MSKFNHIALGLALLAGAQMVNAERVTEVKDWWENQSVFAVNKEDAHATYTPYPSVAALQADAEFYAHPWVESRSAYRMSLNGTWKFNYASRPERRPKTFYKTDFDYSDWKDITVPSCWAMEGYDTPMYINVDFPFQQSKCPKIVKRNDNDGYDENPVGSYIRTFTLPSSWADKQLFLNFEGIYSAAYVWLNGEFVGYTQAANTDHEFDVTSMARKGTNTLAVQVIKWSDGSYLEDQDMFRWGGIHRDVTLTAVPKTFVRDHYITSDLKASNGIFKSGTINVELEVENRSTNHFVGTLELKLMDLDGQTVKASFPGKNFEINGIGSQTINLSTQVSDVLNWTAETPNLYTLIVCLKDSQGKETEAFATKYGFRKIDIKNKFVRINNQKVFFKGVNRQDTHPLTGRTMSLESLIKDVTLFKQFNINTVRTSHCPHQAKMMALYDHYGIYVMDEADLETHAMNWALVDDSSWTAAYVDRQKRMVGRDRNHPSVIFWSMGNESRNGSNFAACREAIAELDSRFVHYEGQQVAGFPNSDFTSKMYPYENDVVNMDRWSDERPHFICEYAHSMGQSLGNFVDYWDYFENSNRTIGGCIWDWADQAIYHPTEIANGTYAPGRFYTGYDFPGPHQGNFVSNGVVGPLRDVTAKLVEVKKVHQWIKMNRFEPDRKRIYVTNTYDFIDLSGFSVVWNVSRDGVTVETGTVDDFNVDSERGKYLNIPYKTEITDDAEYLLTIQFVTREASDWADAGHVVAEEQVAINERPSLPEIDLSGMTASLQTRGNGPVTISGPGFFYQFDASGNLQAMNFDGHDYIYDGNGLKFDSFRWIENDSPYSGTPPTSMQGYTLPSTGLYCTFVEGDASGAKAVRLVAKFDNPEVAAYTNTYIIYADGTMDLETSYVNRKGDLQRLGQSIALNPALENLEYFARGPWSNYNDRKTASFAAVYSSTVTDQHEQFVRPQSMGNHEDLRYLKLTSPNDPNYGLLIETQGRVSFSALHYQESDYSVTHDFQLEARPEVVLHLDYQQTGLGNGSCGSTIWSRYLIPTGKTLSNKLRFTPLHTPGAGYVTPTGNLGAYATEISQSEESGIHYSANSRPDQYYNAISHKAVASPGKTLTLNVKTDKAAGLSARVDLNHDFSFDASEALTVSGSTLTFDVPANLPEGAYRLRLFVCDGSAVWNADKGAAYDINLIVTESVSDVEAEYEAPNGSMHSEGKAWVKSITSTGALTNIEYTADSKPKKFHTVLPDAIDVYAGGHFALNFQANESTQANNSGTHQDLRFNFAVIFADYNNSGKFERVAVVGRRFTGANTTANYDVVMNFTQNFSVPADVRTKFGRIRVIYENAWRNIDNVDPYIQTVTDGVSYDIRLNILEADGDNSALTTLPEPTRDTPSGTMHPDGNAWVKAISSSGAKTNINCSWTTAPENVYTLLSETIEAEQGSEFTLSLEANEALTANASGHYQDLRFNHATFFSDWYNTFDMLPDITYGDYIKGENATANLRSVMNISHTVVVPEDAAVGNNVIRVIYQNAWKDQPLFNEKNIHEGVAYDIPVRVLKNNSAITEITAPSALPNAVYDLQGRRIFGTPRPGIYIMNGIKTLIR